MSEQRQGSASNNVGNGRISTPPEATVQSKRPQVTQVHKSHSRSFSSGTRNVGNSVPGPLHRSSSVRLWHRHYGSKGGDKDGKESSSDEEDDSTSGGVIRPVVQRQVSWGPNPRSSSVRVGGTRSDERLQQEREQSLARELDQQYRQEKQFQQYGAAGPDTSSTAAPQQSQILTAEQVLSPVAEDSSGIAASATDSNVQKVGSTDGSGPSAERVGSLASTVGLSRRSSIGSIAPKDLQELLSSAYMATSLHGRDSLPADVTAAIRNAYLRLKPEDRGHFFVSLVRVCGLNEADILQTAAELHSLGDSGDHVAFTRTANKLRAACIPLYEVVFTAISQQVGGVKFLVDMRKDLLEFLAQTRRNPTLRATGGDTETDSELLTDKEVSDIKFLNNSLRDLLADWFSVGVMDLQRITWASPAYLVEKLKNYEAVHAVDDMMGLKQRLAPGRRCYAFLHNSMPTEPLVVTYIALLPTIADNVQKIIEEPIQHQDPPVEDITTAIFYSISSTQRGLSGVDLGNFLIKRVVFELRQEFSSMVNFCTLSPIPAFSSWLDQVARKRVDPEPSLQEALRTVADALGSEQGSAGAAVSAQSELPAIASALLEFPKKDVVTSQTLREPMMRLCGRYLALQKRGGAIFDPVGNFHVRNGAQMYRLNWAANTSERGLRESFGMMVNYKYDLATVEHNNMMYLQSYEVDVGGLFRQTIEE
eukprot:Clim_evm9s16 gene=Clim_evmTU9s16